MNLTASLARSQLKSNRKRTAWTLLGIALSSAMITAVYGFAVSAIDTLYGLTGELRDLYVTTFVIIGSILSLVIVAASVIVVSNSFRISAGERMTQFGILKSVGATKRQIAKTVMHEGIILSAIGIPVGIMLGLAVQFTGLQIANYLLGGVIESQAQTTDHTFNFIIAWQAIIASATIAFLTVLVSAWMPARKAAKVPAINAIRGVGEVTISAKQVRSNWLVKTVFGFEGALASKSLKRNKRNFRATVVSLTISIIMFVAVSSFGTHLNRMANVVLSPTNADVLASFNSWATTVRNEGGTYEYGSFIYNIVNNEQAEIITEKLREFPSAAVIGAGSMDGGFRGQSIGISGTMLTSTMRNILTETPILLPGDGYFNMPITLITVDTKTYSELSAIAGVPFGSNILINYSRQHIDGRWIELTPFIFNYQTVEVGTGQGNVIDLPLHGELVGDQIPRELLHISGANRRSVMVVIVLELDSVRYEWFVTTNRPREFTAFAHGILDEFLPPVYPYQMHTNVQNIAATENAERNIIRLVMVFTYGFVGMLTLIGLTNVISTISTNVRSRAREFAVLQSVGMTHRGINRMLNLESILCSAKSLIIGLPLGVGASYLIHRAILVSVYFSFSFPWFPIVQAALAVFVITWLTMRYSAARLRGKNIVETIRAE